MKWSEPSNAEHSGNLCKKVSLVIGEQVILKNITAQFTDGKIYGLVGHNGSGKTMLMKCICGFVRPTVGGVRINDEWLGLQQDFPESIGAIIETPGVIPYYTAQKIVFTCRFARKNRKRKSA